MFAKMLVLAIFEIPLSIEQLKLPHPDSGLINGPHEAAATSPGAGLLCKQVAQPAVIAQGQQASNVFHKNIFETRL